MGQVCQGQAWPGMTCSGQMVHAQFKYVHLFIFKCPLLKNVHEYDIMREALLLLTRVLLVWQEHSNVQNGANCEELHFPYTVYTVYSLIIPHVVRCIIIYKDLFVAMKLLLHQKAGLCFYSSRQETDFRHFSAHCFTDECSTGCQNVYQQFCVSQCTNKDFSVWYHTIHRLPEGVASQSFSCVMNSLVRTDGDVFIASSIQGVS